MHYNSHKLLRNNPSAIVILQRLIDPIAAIALLIGLSQLYQIPFQQPYILLGVIILLAIPPLFKLAGLYRSYRNSSAAAIAPRLLLAWGITLASLLFLGYSTKTSDLFSRSLLISWAILAPLLIYFIHLSILNVLRRLRAAGHNTRTAVIVGANPVGQHLAAQIQQAPYLGIKLRGFFTPLSSDQTLVTASLPLLGTLEELPDYVRRYRIDVVYLALPNREETAIAQLIEQLQDTTACVYFVPNIFLFSLMQAQSYEINGVPLIAVWEIPFTGAQYTLKRLLDLMLAGLALVLLLPVMLLIAIGVKLSSPGPILFKQRRYGINGQEIVVYKFRSMKVMEDGDVVTQAKRNDSRVTRFGAFIRRTSLDELPQLLNVLQGRMSLVGPRPHAVAHNEQYRKLIHGYMLRHKVKPGITGWAQIHGLRGETDTLDKMKQRLEYDLHYFKNWSLWLDLQILLRTALVFFHSQNAY